MLYKFNEFISSILIEELHPELKELIKTIPIPSTDPYKHSGNYRKSNTSRLISKQALLASKIRELVNRGEKTGIEENMPKGSSRAYLPEKETKNIMLDNKPASIKVGTKVAIKSVLDDHHNINKYDGLFLGALQNKAEGGDHYVNNRYRILNESAESPGHFTTNEENGIFPPLFEHDHENHEYSQVGHCRDIKSNEFAELTKNPEHPNGITHAQFCSALHRNYTRNNGRYWPSSPEQEKKLNNIESHPLVQKFIDYFDSTGDPPHDLETKQNMGIFEHPNGTRYIVARDHGFNTQVMNAYQDARLRRNFPIR